MFRTQSNSSERLGIFKAPKAEEMKFQFLQVPTSKHQPGVASPSKWLRDRASYRVPEQEGDGGSAEGKGAGGDRGVGRVQSDRRKKAVNLEIA